MVWKDIDRKMGTMMQDGDPVTGSTIPNAGAVFQRNQRAGGGRQGAVASSGDPMIDNYANAQTVISNQLKDYMEAVKKENGNTVASQILFQKIQALTKQAEQLQDLFASIRALPFKFSDKFGQKLGI